MRVYSSCPHQRSTDVLTTSSSGLRKKVKVFQQPHYAESFVTATLLSIPEGVEGSTLVIGGDGRFWNPEVTQLIAKIGAAYGVKKLIVGHNGILSTPAASHIIRLRKATGGILLTASHNPGGMCWTVKRLKFNNAKSTKNLQDRPKTSASSTT